MFDEEQAFDLEDIKHRIGLDTEESITNETQESTPEMEATSPLEQELQEEFKKGGIKKMASEMGIDELKAFQLFKTYKKGGYYQEGGEETKKKSEDQVWNANFVKNKTNYSNSIRVFSFFLLRLFCVNFKSHRKHLDDSAAASFSENDCSTS